MSDLGGITSSSLRADLLLLIRKSAEGGEKKKKKKKKRCETQKPIEASCWSPELSYL